MTFSEFKEAYKDLENRYADQEDAELLLEDAMNLMNNFIKNHQL